MTSSSATDSYSVYDALGRPGATLQTVGTATYPFTGLAWTPSGDMKSMTYPTGRTVLTTFDNAGRPLNVSGVLGSAATSYTSTGAQNAAHGGISQLNTGEGVSRAIRYNLRLQIASLGEFGDVAVAGIHVWDVGFGE